MRDRNDGVWGGEDGRGSEEKKRKCRSFRAGPDRVGSFRMTTFTTCDRRRRAQDDGVGEWREKKLKRRPTRKYGVWGIPRR
jgi:hypothetical protein